MMVVPSLPLLAGPSRHATDDRQDSVRLYRYDEVVVSAERYPLSAGKAGAVTHSVRPSGSSRFGGPGESLAGVRNLSILRYGGGMSLQTLSIRGMGSEHTLVLWNGLPAGNLQTGVSDLNLFSAADLEEIEVVPGGASALHGSGAVGGVVNMIPSIPYETTPRLELSAWAGSFEENGFSLRTMVQPLPALGLSIRAGRSRSRGDFPFHDPVTGAEAIRSNSDFLTQSVSAAAGLIDGDSNRFALVLNGLSLDQGTPGPWLGGTASSTARRNDRRYLAALSFEHTPSGPVNATATAIYDAQYERFLDTEGPYPADNHYRTTSVGASAQVRLQPAPSWLFLAGSDLNLAWAGGNAVDKTRKRGMAALSASASWTFSIGDGIATMITPSGRVEASSAFDPHFSPKLGLNVEAEGGGHSARIHSTVGSGRRNPTMNELYYSGEGGIGNPDIRGESSVSLDAGFGGRLDFLGGLEGDVTWYLIDMDDRIQWIPTVNPRVWSPRNIGTSRSTGWEFGGEFVVFPGTLRILGNYSTISAKRGVANDDRSIRYDKQLTYIPLDKGSLDVVFESETSVAWLRSFKLRLGILYLGERYILDDNSESLPSHLTFDGSASFEIPISGGGLLMHYSAVNMTGVNYEVMPGYPMPLFNHNLTITYKIII